jgi:hypothetical protein
MRKSVYSTRPKLPKIHGRMNKELSCSIAVIKTYLQEGAHTHTHTHTCNVATHPSRSGLRINNQQINTSAGQSNAAHGTAVRVSAVAQSLVARTLREPAPSEPRQTFRLASSHTLLGLTAEKLHRCVHARDVCLSTILDAGVKITKLCSLFDKETSPKR